MPQGALATVKPQTIIDRYLAGELTDKIAKDLDCTRQALWYHMMKHAEAEWKDAQVILALERKEKAQIAMDSATTALDLARAREQLKSAQWDLERVLKRIFGPSAEVTGKDGGPLTVEIIRYSPTVIEGEVGESVDHSLASTSQSGNLLPK